MLDLPPCIIARTQSSDRAIAQGYNGNIGTLNIKVPIVKSHSIFFISKQLRRLEMLSRCQFCHNVFVVLLLDV